MAMRVFPWGTVRNTLKGVTLILGRGIQADMSAVAANDMADWIDKPTISYNSMFTTGSPMGDLCFEWDPPVLTPTAHSILKIGYGSWMSIAPGVVPILLSRAESLELAEALRFVAKSAQTTNVVQATPSLRLTPIRNAP